MALRSIFDNEGHLCRVFTSNLPQGWTAYNETAGFDILLRRESDGAQVGVEAKMTLNAKVLLQAAQGLYSSIPERQGPDFRAALVPQGTASPEMVALARMLGVTVIQCFGNKDQFLEAEVKRYGEHYRRWALQEIDRNFKAFQPDLPNDERYDWKSNWIDLCPSERCSLPDYIPDVKAGLPSPSSLSEWKVKAIKLCVLLEKRGHIVNADFSTLKISKQRWISMKWLVTKVVDGKLVRGVYVAGPHKLGLERLHPINYQQINDDFDKWNPDKNGIA